LKDPIKAFLEKQMNGETCCQSRGFLHVSPFYWWLLIIMEGGILTQVKAPQEQIKWKMTQPIDYLTTH